MTEEYSMRRRDQRPGASGAGPASGPLLVRMRRPVAAQHLRAGAPKGAGCHA